MASKQRLSKVQVTSAFQQWWESDLTDIFDEPDEVTIISAVIENGGLYLIYTYIDESDK